jgi:hypothetical protein
MAEIKYWGFKCVVEVFSARRKESVQNAETRLSICIVIWREPDILEEHIASIFLVKM